MAPLRYLALDLGVMTTLAEESGYARLGYDAYRIALDEVRFRPPVDDYDDLPDVLRNAWISAADSIKDAVLTDLGAHMAMM